MQQLCFQCGMGGSTSFCVCCGYDLSDPLLAADLYRNGQGKPIASLCDTTSNQVFRFHQVPTVIGRWILGCTAKSDIRNILSEYHALLLFRRGEWFLLDLHTPNGTAVNHTPVLVPVKLASGDIITFGGLRSFAFSIAYPESQSHFALM